MGNIMSYNSDSLAQTNGAIGQASTKAADAQNIASSGFSGMNTLFGSGLGAIGSQLGSLQGSLSNIQGIMSRQTEAMFTMDEVLAKAADAIDVPQDFVKNESNRFTEYHDMLLEKLDGESVNKGKEDHVEGKIDDTIIAGEALGDITTSTEAKEEVYDATSSIAGQKAMSNITTGGGAERQTYNADSAIGSAEALGNINNGNGLTREEIRDNSRIAAQEALKDMTGKGGLTEQTLHDITGNLQSMKNISNGNGTEEVNLAFDESGSLKDAAAAIPSFGNIINSSKEEVAPPAEIELGSVVEMASEAANEATEEKVKEQG